MLQFFLGLAALACRRRRCGGGRRLATAGRRRHDGEGRRRRRRVRSGDDRPLERVVLADELHGSGDAGSFSLSAVDSLRQLVVYRTHAGTPNPICRADNVTC